MDDPDLFSQAQEPVERPKEKFDVENYLAERNKVLRALFPDDKELFEIKP